MRSDVDGFGSDGLLLIDFWRDLDEDFSDRSFLRGELRLLEWLLELIYNRNHGKRYDLNLIIYKTESKAITSTIR